MNPHTVQRQPGELCHAPDNAAALCRLEYSLLAFFLFRPKVCFACYKHHQEARLEKANRVEDLTCAVTAPLTTGFSLPRCMNFICRSRLLKAGFFVGPSALPSAMTGQPRRQSGLMGWRCNLSFSYNCLLRLRVSVGARKAQGVQHKAVAAWPA